MDSGNFTPLTENTATGSAETTGDKVDFCMKHYQPYLRKDFSLQHLSLIINVPVKDIENYFGHSSIAFEQYLCKWRVKLAKSLLDKETSWNLDIKTIGSLSGFSSTKKFTEAFFRFEGISPEEYQSQINKSKSI